jgi:DNA polymerase III delta prime subunit
MFESGLKFVVLDEVDYMTNNAQQALKNLLQSCLNNVRFCLICNYICKIDESLKNEFICIRFNQLPREDIYTFIKNIAHQEKVDLSDEVIYTVQKMFHSDIRSMINFLQLHQNDTNFHEYLMVDTVWEKLHQLFCSYSRESKEEEGNSAIKIIQWIRDTSISCNLDMKTMMKHFFNYMIKNHSEMIQSSFLNIVEIIVHNVDANVEHILRYFVYQIIEEYRKM